MGILSMALQHQMQQNNGLKKNNEFLDKLSHAIQFFSDLFQNWDFKNSLWDRALDTPVDNAVL